MMSIYPNCHGNTADQVINPVFDKLVKGGILNLVLKKIR